MYKELDNVLFFFFQAEDGIRDLYVTGVQTCALPICPRLALAMLAVHTPECLRTAVANQDLTALMRVPGIGRKGAQRIVLELTDRLGAPSGGTGAGGAARSEERRVGKECRARGAAERE